MSFEPDKITFFAKTDARGQAIPFGIKSKDRQRHMYVVGKTGMGKSTLLENMAVQDIQNDEGMAFIDPHGSAAETLLDYIPEHRKNDVIYFAPFDMENPIAFNVMEDVGFDKRHLVVSGLISTFKKIWVDQWSARMEYILTNALLALIEYPDTTLLSVNRLFVDKQFRNQVVNYIKDPAVKAFWTDEFANYTDRFAAEALPAIQNKIGQFTGNPLIRNIIGQPNSSFDIRKIMDERKILIMNLSKGLIGETNANLLGSMLTTRIYLAAMSRADLSLDVMKTMPNFYFYVDEFQSFANATFADILSEARKYHLNLIIAHQYIEQMEEEVRNAVFGNVGTTIAFRVGPFDAEVLETVFSPQFLATDLVNLGFAQIYLTLMIDGVGSQPFSAETLAPIARPRVSCRDMVIAASRRQFGNQREEVEKVVAELHNPTVIKTQTGNSGNPRQPKVNNEKRRDYSQSDSRKDSVPVPKRTDEKRPEPLGEAKEPLVKTDKRVEDKKPYETGKNNFGSPPSKSLDDLRHVLASLSKTEGSKEDRVAKKPNQTTLGDNEKKEDKKGTVQPTTNHKSKEKNKLKGQDLKQALSAALGDLSSTSKTDSQNTNTPKPDNKVSTKDVKALKNKQELERLVAETEKALAKIEQASNQNASPDPKVVKTMLNQSQEERNPFN